MNSTITTAAVTMRYSITFIDEIFASAAQYSGKNPYTTSATTIAVTPCGVCTTRRPPDDGRSPRPAPPAAAPVPIPLRIPSFVLLTG